jgi:hypothetical protein
VNAVAEAASRVLIENWRGASTVPAGGLYPHQWSWDSAFIAIGLRHLSPRRAQLELDTLLFDVRRDDGYSPGAAFWRSERIPGSPVVPTAGLIQPPNHALAVWMVHESDPVESGRRGFLERAYPRLAAWHAYLRERRTGTSGLAHVVHPWESGMDNSPYWDAALAATRDDFDGEIPRPDLQHAAADHRPSNAEYGKYLALAARYRDHDCDDRDAGYPFRLEDPAFNALWARSELALAEIADAIGSDPAPHRARAAELRDALESLWHPELGVYTARDLVSTQRQPYRTVSGLIPLLVPGVGHAGELLAALRGPHFALGRVAMVPSHDLTAPTFDASRYWRGPSWFNTAWMIAEALHAMGERDAARSLALDVATSALLNNFPEYIDPHSRSPRGTLRFSWTASLSLDLITRLGATP